MGMLALRFRADLRDFGAAWGFPEFVITCSGSGTGRGCIAAHRSIRPSGWSLLCQTVDACKRERAV
jgi:hypothetical protein